MPPFRSQIIAEIIAEILWPTYKCDELSARPLTLSQVSSGGCVMYMHPDFSHLQVCATTCTQWHAYISVSGACHFLHPVTSLHFSVRHACVTSCIQWLAYISVCGMRVSLLASSDSLTFQCAAGMCHFVHSLTSLHFSVRYACVTSCIHSLTYISVCSRRMPLLEPSDSLNFSVQQAPCPFLHPVTRLQFNMHYNRCGTLEPNWYE